MAKKTIVPKSPDTCETIPLRDKQKTLSAEGKDKCPANDLSDKNLLLGTWRITGIYVRCVRMLGKTSPLLSRYPETDAAEHDLVLFRGRLWEVGRAWSKNDTNVLSGLYWTFSADGVMAEWSGKRIRERIGYCFNPRTRKLLFRQMYRTSSGISAPRLTEAFYVETDSRDVLQLYGLEYWAWTYENAPYRFELERADPDKI